VLRANEVTVARAMQKQKEKYTGISEPRQPRVLAGVSPLTSYAGAENMDWRQLGMTFALIGWPP